MNQESHFALAPGVFHIIFYICALMVDSHKRVQNIKRQRKKRIWAIKSESIYQGGLFLSFTPRNFSIKMNVERTEWLALLLICLTCRPEVRGTRLYAAAGSPSFFCTMAACFWPERCLLKTVSLLQTTLHMVQALTAPAAAPPSTIFCFFVSRSRSTEAVDLPLPASGFSIGPIIIGFVVVVVVVACAAVEEEVLVSFFGSASFSKFFRCFFPSMCLV